MPSELVIDSLSAGYGRDAVICGLTARFISGELSCILGPNGAGKSTLLRALCGALSLRAGRILWAGTDLGELPPRERALRIALVPQLTPNDVPLNVREAVALARYPHRVHTLRLSSADQAAVDDALDSLGLLPLATKACSALSGGEWRRVLLAQGLAQGARVLLLDEPTAFLDPPARLAIMQLLRALARERDMALIAVLHDPPLARHFADRALLLSAGAALACGTVEEVLSKRNLQLLYGGPLDVSTALEVV